MTKNKVGTIKNRLKKFLKDSKPQKTSMNLKRLVLLAYLKATLNIAGNRDSGTHL